MKMIKYYNDMIQGGDDWYNIRLGLVTASEINTLLTPSGKLAKNQKMRDFACEIASQRELMEVEDSFQSYNMVRGHIQEVIARDIYSENFEDVEECGFITNDWFAFTLGCSPDGLVGDDGMIEIKSRLAKFQVQTIINGEVPCEYINQIQTALMVSGRKWCDFIQYSNGMPMFVKRVFPDLEHQKLIHDANEVFELEVQRIREDYKNKSSILVKCPRVDLTIDDEITTSEV